MNLKVHNTHVENKLIMYAVKSFNHTKGNNNIDLVLFPTLGAVNRVGDNSSFSPILGGMQIHGGLPNFSPLKHSVWKSQPLSGIQ